MAGNSRAHLPRAQLLASALKPEDVEFSGHELDGLFSGMFRGYMDIAMIHGLMAESCFNSWGPSPCPYRFVPRGDDEELLVKVGAMVSRRTVAMLMTNSYGSVIMH